MTVLRQSSRSRRLSYAGWDAGSSPRKISFNPNSPLLTRRSLFGASLLGVSLDILHAMVIVGFRRSDLVLLLTVSSGRA